MISSFVEHFSELQDPRIERKKLHALMDNLSSSKFTPLANAVGPIMVKALVPGRHCLQYQR
jgi:hypothetical protein